MSYVFQTPVGDNGLGFHDSAGCYALPGDLKAYANYLRNDLGITWYKCFTGGTAKLNYVKELIAAGIQVIVRFHEEGGGTPHPNWVPNIEYVRQYYDLGVRYFECGNEPNLAVEWDGGKVGEAAPDRICEQWLRACDMIEGLGAGDAHCLFYALSPGGHYPHADFYMTAFAWLMNHGELKRLLRHGMAIHNRPLNHPLDYPYDPGKQQRHPGITLDDDSCCFLMYEWLDNVLYTLLGEHVCMIGTEAGPELTQEDSNYPRIDPPLHADFVEGIVRGFRGDNPNPRLKWRGNLLAVCFWLLEGFTHGSFAYNWWKYNMLYEGKDLPALERLKSLSGYTRGTNIPVPPVTPHLDPPRASGEGSWVVNVHRRTPSENNNQHNLFFTVLDAANQPVAGARIEVRCIANGSVASRLTGPDGKVDEPIWPNSEYDCWLSDHPEVKAGPFDCRIWADQQPDYDPEHPELYEGNNYGHWSWEVTFAQRAEVVPMPVADYPGAEFVGAHANGWESGRPGPINEIVIHSAEGTLAGMDAWFNNPQAGCASHYGIGINGAVHQYVSEYDTAYHVAADGHNARSIGIELEGHAGDDFDANPAQWEALVALVKDIRSEYDIVSVVAHSALQKDRSDPGGGFDWDKFSAAINATVQPMPEDWNGPVWWLDKGARLQWLAFERMVRTLGSIAQQAQEAIA